MKNKKKIVRLIWTLSGIFLCLVIGGVVTYAAMTVREEKANLFQIGSLQTKVEEVFTEPTTISPTTPVEKKVTVQNTGTINQFVRVMLQPEIRVKSGDSVRLLPSQIGEEVLLDLNSTQWQLGEDGYYYYLNSVKPGAANSTENLFTQVKLKENLGVEYDKATFNLLIKVEAINCAKYAYRDAWWQGVTPSSGQLKLIDNQLANKAE